MKKRRFILPTFLMVFALCFLFSVKPQAAAKYRWVLDKANARVQYVNVQTNEPVKSKFMKISGYTYYFDKNGYAATGFNKIDGFYYFFRSDGSMVRSQWVADRYFFASGRMASNQYVRDSSGAVTYVGKDGVAIPGYSKTRKAKLIKNSKGYRYRKPDGTYAAKTWQCISGHWYYFYSNGYMARRTQLGKFYVGTNGRMVTNKWVTIGNYKYYYGSDGRLVKKVRLKTTASKNETITIN